VRRTLPLLTLVACASTPPSPPEATLLVPVVIADASAPMATDAGAHPAPVSRVRWEPTEWVSWEGTKGYVAAGRRVLRDATGDRVVDPADPPLEHVLKVPVTLGRGYVFLASIDVYASERFDGPLQTVVKRTDRVGRRFVGLGFDAIYLDYSGTSLERYELPSGRALPVEPPAAVRVFGHPAGYVVAAVNGSYVYAEAPGKWRPLNLKVDSQNEGNIFWHAKDGLLVNTPKGLFAVEAGGKTKPSARRVNRDFFVETTEHGAFVERGSNELHAVGDVSPWSSHGDLWDERLEGDVVAMKHAACSGAKSKPNALCIKRRDGTWSDAWMPNVKIDWGVAIWASKDDTLLGLVGSNQACILVAPLERRHLALPCPGSTVLGEAHERGSITPARALRVVLGHVGGLRISEISLDGKVVNEELPPHIHASTSGRRGLLVLTDHTLVETNDDGRSWMKVPSPPFGASRVQLASGLPRGWLAGCSETGCRFYDGTRRVGWELP
jgi:hypothetical protein